MNASPQTLKRASTGSFPSVAGSTSRQVLLWLIRLKGLDLDNLIKVCSAKLEDDETHYKALFLRASSYAKQGRFPEVLPHLHPFLLGHCRLQPTRRPIPNQRRRLLYAWERV